MTALLALLGSDLAGLALACGVAFLASILGGLAGYGTGLVLPLFLAPVVGVINVIPVMAMAMIFNNGSRVVVFRHGVQWRQAARLLAFGLPACLLGAYGYTRLDARWAALLLGGFLLGSVPLRRWLAQRGLRLTQRAEWGAGAVFGVVNGAVSGAGLILIAVLLATGSQGAAVIATDAIVSLTMGVAKVILFSGLAALDAHLAAVGLLVGLCTIPGAFVARVLLKHISPRGHAIFMEVIIVFGAALLLWRGLR